MRLSELLQRYADERGLERDSLKVPRAAINSFSAYLAQPAELEHLSSERLNAWLSAEVERVSKRTAKNHRAALVTLWRWLFDDAQLVETEPRRIRKVRAPLAPVEAYTPEEVERLLHACDQLDDRFCRLPVRRAALYRALLLASWDTGFRPGDLMRLRWSNIADNGCVRINQHKTDRPVVRWLDKSTLGALDAIRLNGEPLVFGRLTCQETWRSVFRSLRAIAGIERGTPKWIRRAAATSIAALYGEEAAGKALGHATAGMARKHYIDASQILAAQLRTPRLKGRRKRA